MGVLWLIYIPAATVKPHIRSKYMSKITKAAGERGLWPRARQILRKKFEKEEKILKEVQKADASAPYVSIQNVRHREYT